MNTSRRLSSHLIILALCLTAPTLGQTKVEPGFNLFSPQQDVEIGRQSAAEVEKQLPVLNDRRVRDYVRRVGNRLVRATPGPEYPYRFDLINSAEVNAFALPGGFMYLNRGLIEAAETEAELAGVMAHEIAHVALRHGTNQASKAYLAQAGFGILGGLLGNSTAGDIVGAVGGFGLNTLFLKFSRSAEKKADILAAQILARAGYDPNSMVDFFEKLQARAGRDPSKFEQFFSSHPTPDNRAARVREEIRLIGDFETRGPSGDLRAVQRRLDRLPDPPSQRAAEGSQERQGRIEAPASRFEEFRHRSGLFEIDYPRNWRVHESSQNIAVTIVPEGGVVQAGRGSSEIIYGTIISHYEPFEDRFGSSFRHDDTFGRASLEEATEDLIHQLLRSNTYLEVANRSWRRERLDGAQAISVTLSGISPVIREREQVTLFTRLLDDGHVLYSLFIAPASDYPALGHTFERMLASLDVNDHNHR